MGWQALDKEGFVAKSGLKRFETTVHHIHFQLAVIELMDCVVVKFAAIVDQGVEIWEESVLMILHCRFLDFLFARCQNGHFSDAVKRPFLRSSFSIFPESVLNC